MKKTIILSALMAVFAISANAQLEVDLDGNVSIGTNAPLSNTSLNIGAYYFSNFRHAINVGLPSANNALTNTAISSTVSSISPSSGGRSIGVSGVSGVYTSGYNYGILGGINTSKNGAGIFGTTNHHTGVYVGGQYAGFFDGPTYCNNTITASSFVNLSDIRLNENVSQLSTSTRAGSTLANIMRMNVISYQYKDREIPEAERDTISAELAQEMYGTEKNLHYGLSAQELQAIYPDLVYKGQDGYYGVNYVELIPILIRAIQELKQELETKENGSIKRAPAATGTNTAIGSGNVLYQNTPNPFKEQTTIRFSLADDARDASVCIFDMTGKMLKNLPISSGETSVSVNGWELGQGMFLYTLIVNGKEVDTKRMIITK